MYVVLAFDAARELLAAKQYRLVTDAMLRMEYAVQSAPRYLFSRAEEGRWNVLYQKRSFFLAYRTSMRGPMSGV